MIKMLDYTTTAERSERADKNRKFFILLNVVRQRTRQATAKIQFQVERLCKKQKVGGNLWDETDSLSVGRAVFFIHDQNISCLFFLVLCLLLLLSRLHIILQCAVNQVREEGRKEMRIVS